MDQSGVARTDTYQLMTDRHFDRQIDPIFIGIHSYNGSNSVQLFVLRWTKHGPLCGSSFWEVSTFDHPVFVGLVQTIEMFVFVVVEYSSTEQTKFVLHFACSNFECSDFSKLPCRTFVTAYTDRVFINVLADVVRMPMSKWTNVSPTWEDW